MNVSSVPMVSNNIKIILLVFSYVAIQLLNGFYLSLLSQSAVLYWLYDIAANAILPSMIYWLLVKIDVLPKAYGFKKPHLLYDTTQMVGQALALFMVAGLVYFISYQILWRFYPPSVTFLYSSVMSNDPVLRWVTNLYFSATAGLVESVVYLGIAKLIVEKRFTGRAGNIIFVMASTLIFTSVHWEQCLMPMVTAGCMQLIFSLAYLRIKYLPPFILAHAAIDFVIFY